MIIYRPLIKKKIQVIFQIDICLLSSEVSRLHDIMTPKYSLLTILTLDNYKHPSSNQLKMNRRKRPVVINLTKTQTGYVVDTAKREKAAVHFDLQSHLSESSSIQDPFHINFNAAPKLPSSSVQTTLPVTASWFHLQKIHKIQKQALPQFFGQTSDTQDKNKDDYVYYRNSIVALWRENNKKYLTSSYCRKNIVGDSCSITRVHGFLEDLGIINFPSKQYKGYVKKIDKRVECMVCSNLSFKLYVTEEIGPIFQICQKCYYQRIFPQKLDISQFRQLDLSNDNFEAQENPWTQQQTFKLLEMIERYRSNWNNIAAEFPNRSIQSLIVHYLKLPYLNISNFSIFEEGEDIKEPAERFQTPTIFQDYNNPLQAAIATLYFRSKTEPCNEKYEQLLKAGEKHSKYLAAKQEQKIRNILRFIIDFEMNKLEGKLVCLHQYKKYVEIQKCNNQSIRKNIIGSVLHGLNVLEQN